MKSLFAILSISCFLCACNNNKVTQTTSSDIANKSWTLLPFVKVDSVNPILAPGNNSFICPVQNKKVYWEEKNVFNPAIVVRNDTLFMLYRAQDSAGTSRIGLAYSVDGMHFTRNKEPVLYPANDAYKNYEWQGGCEDPRVTMDSAGVYYMTYTAYDGTTARLLIATSTDLLHWQKHGCVFAKEMNGKYLNVWSKSGSIVSKYVDGKIVAQKINGRYWMFWGDKYIWLATSNNLINWSPVETTDQQPYDSVYANHNIASLKIIVSTRPNKFDCNIVESGPPAMLTDKGILLLYNGRNVKTLGDSLLPDGAYTSSQVLFDKNDPTKIIDRMDTYFMRPEKPYEITGEVNQVCFIEGLAQYKNRWWLYYGTADSKIAVAVK
jgi:predicted GH43/DUF377 family glycosyl hydrolase